MKWTNQVRPWTVETGTGGPQAPTPPSHNVLPVGARLPPITWDEVWRPKLEMATVREILEESIQGAFELTVQLTPPHVVVRASTATGLTIRETARVQLTGRPRRVPGPGGIFAFVLDLTAGERLVAYDGWMTPHTSRKRRERPHVAPVHLPEPVLLSGQEGGEPEVPAPVIPRPVPQPPITLVVAPEPALAPREIPAHMQEFCQREDLHPDLGDYLVIPTAQQEQYAPLEPWMVLHPDIQEVHVVKPRADDVDRPLTPA